LNKQVDKWVWADFDNPARKDSFKLYHWMKEKERDEVYPFSRFNRQAEVIRYTDDEYEKVVEPLSTDWTREETDHLLNLCERFSLRFIVIADRFDITTLEDDLLVNNDYIKKRD
jgi:DNA methyltransferase 1-associated protein 1